MQQPDTGPRIYTPYVSLPSNVFHESEGAYVLPLVPVPSGMTLSFDLLSEASSIQPFHVLQARERLVLAFVSSLQAENLGSALLLTYPSWMSQRSRKIAEGEVFTSFRHPGGVYAFSVLNKVTLITSWHVSDRIHEFLTMM